MSGKILPDTAHPVSRPPISPPIPLPWELPYFDVRVLRGTGYCADRPNPFAVSTPAHRQSHV